MSWDAVSALSSAAGVVVVIVATVLALRQFAESLQSRSLQGILGMAEQLESKSVRVTRKKLRDNNATIRRACADSIGLQDLDARLKDATAGQINLQLVRDDLAVLEYCAVLAAHDVIPSRIAIAFFLPIVVDSWPSMEPIVSLTRKEYGSNVYLQHFESIYQLAVSGDFRRHKSRKRNAARLASRSMYSVQWRPGDRPRG